MHLLQLVHQHIAGGANIAFEAAAAAQHQGLAESAAIGEAGEVQFNGQHALQVLRQDISIIAQLQIGGLKLVCV